MVKLSFVCLTAVSAILREAPAEDEWQPMRALITHETQVISGFALAAKAVEAMSGDGDGEEETKPYAGIAEADKEATKAAFIPACSTKLEEISKKMHKKMVGRDKHNQLGHAMSTHMMVQCQRMPIEKEDCSKFSTQLQKMVEAGNPYKAPNATEETTEETTAAPAEFLQADPSNVTVPEHGDEWCENFFEVFFEGVVAAVAKEAEDEAETEAALLVQKYGSHQQRLRVNNADVWHPMRLLLKKEMQKIVQIAAKKAVGKQSPHGAPAKESYATAGEADKAAVGEIFAPICATKLAEIKDNMLTNAGGRDAEDMLGVSMATHLQVQCGNGLPIEEEVCDEMSMDLFRLIESGNPIAPVVEEANSTNGTNATIMPASDEEAPAEEAPVEEEPAAEFIAIRAHNSTNGTTVHADGTAWCKDLFEVFFDGIVAQVEAEASAGEEGEGEGEAAAEGEGEAAAELIQKMKPHLRANVVRKH